MSATTRHVVVDDTDPRVQYSGSWFLDQGSQDGFGIYGPEYNHTLHGTNANNAGIAFSFNGMFNLYSLRAPLNELTAGTSVRVYGSMNTVDQKAPTWDCFVDKINIGSLPPQATSEHDNNFILCDLAQVADGQHTIVVNTTSAGPTFWFDSIIYAPSPSDSLDTVVLQIQNQDPSIVFGNGWINNGDITNLTNITGSALTFKFNGMFTHLISPASN